MRLVSVAVLALAVAACVGDRTELGGVDSRMDIPAQSQACKASDLKLIVPGKFEFPGDALIFYYAQQKNMSLKSMKLRYDVNEAGVPVNIAYAGPPADMKHATKQKLIRASVDGLKGRRYEWVGAPSFAVGCETTTELLINIYTEVG